MRLIGMRTVCWESRVEASMASMDEMKLETFTATWHKSEFHALDIFNDIL